VAILATFGLLRHDGGVVRAEPMAAAVAAPVAASERPRVVAVAPLGTINRRQVFQILVNQLTGEVIAFGYFMYIHGLDDNALYTENNWNEESRAFFHLYIKGRITRLHLNGNLLIYQLLSHSRISYNPGHEGDFSNPESFNGGIQIATGDEDGTFTYNLDTGQGEGDVRLRQTGAWPFTFNGELIQFGVVGNHNVLWRGKPQFFDLFGWTRVYCTATTVQAAPAPVPSPISMMLPFPRFLR
jgi:hypothetical protein